MIIKTIIENFTSNFNIRTTFSVLQSQRSQALVYCTFPLWPKNKNRYIILFSPNYTNDNKGSK